MPSPKSIWWSLTAFNDDIQIAEGKLPNFVKSIYGGRESCPETGKEHFQGAVQCYEQIRLVKLKEWLPTAHWEPCRSIEALKKYAMKPQTATGEKTIRKNAQIHYSADEICLMLAKVQTDRQTGISFYGRVKLVLSESPELAGQLMNPSLRKFFEETKDVWVHRAIVLQHDENLCEMCDEPAAHERGGQQVCTACANFFDRN